MSGETYQFVKKNFLLELDFVSYVGGKIFIYPFIGRSRTSMTCYTILFLLITITTVQLFTTLCVTSDRFEIINMIPNLGVVLMTMLKYTKIHTHRKLYAEIFTHFRDDLWSVVADEVGYRNIVLQHTTTTRFVIRFVFYYCIPLVIIVNSFPRIIMYYEVYVTNKELQYLYPYDGWYPFDKVKWYYVVYLWECCMTNLVIGIVAVTNGMHAAFTFFICTELNVLRHSIENIISAENVNHIKDNIDVDQTHRAIKKKFKKIASQYQLLARMSSNLNSVLGDSMLLTYIFGSVFIGLTLFTASVEDNMYKAIRYFFMCCSLVLDCFYHCMIGQVLSDHSGSLANSIYSADWPYADTDTKIMLTIFIMRAQKPFKYTAKGFLDMNLDTFSGICSHSFQLFNLVRQVYEKQGVAKNSNIF